MICIGIDNGVSGSIGIINTDTGDYMQLPVPVKKELNYTKAKQYITRIDIKALKKILHQSDSDVRIMLERPMVNPTRFKATTSALRALEATLIVIEEMNYSFEYIDSKTWQRAMLPHGLKGASELKKASAQIGKRLFPKIALKKGQDCDGILIAEYLRRSL